MAKVLSLKQLLQKKFQWLEELPKEITDSFGTLTKNFVMIIWGQSGNGKSNMVMQLLKALMKYGKVLYVSYEEGTDASMQIMAIRQLSEEYSGRIRFADNSMKLNPLRERLRKPRMEQFIVIDSIQYMDIDYTQYKALKEEFPNKTFIFLSHAKGRQTVGKTASKVRYDANIKARVEGYIAFIESRLQKDGTTKNFVIWEKGAKNYWGKKFKEALARKI